MTSRWTGGSLLTVLVLTLTVAGTMASFVVARAVVREQNARLLSQQAAEVKALLRVAINAIDRSLQILGPLCTESDAVARALFARSAAPQLQGRVTALGVAVEGDGPDVASR